MRAKNCRFVRTAVIFIAGSLAASVPLLAQEPAEAVDVQPGFMLSAESLLGSPVRNEAGEKAAEVDQLMIDPENGSIRFVVVSLEDPDRGPVAIPWSYLTVEEDGSLRLRATEEELRRAPSFPSQEEAATAPQPEPPPSQVVEEAEAEGSISVVRSPEQAPRAQEETGARRAAFAPTERFARRFDPSNVKSYRGVIVGTMTAPIEGRTDDVTAIVDVGEEDVRAHFAPKFFLDQLGLELAPDQSIAFEGSPVTLEDETIVVLVSKVTIRDRTYSLRNPDGTPLWSPSD